MKDQKLEGATVIAVSTRLDVMRPKLRSSNEKQLR